MSDNEYAAEIEESSEVLALIREWTAKLPEDHRQSDTAKAGLATAAAIAVFLNKGEWTYSPTERNSDPSIASGILSHHTVGSHYAVSFTLSKSDRKPRLIQLNSDWFIKLDDGTWLLHPRMSKLPGPFLQAMSALLAAGPLANIGIQ